MEERVVNDIHRQLELIQDKLETLTALDVRQQQAIETIYQIRADLKELDNKYNALSREVVAEETLSKNNTRLLWLMLSALGAGGGLAFSLTDFI